MTELGKRNFAAYIERSQAEEFLSRTEKLRDAFLSSLESAIYDPSDQEGSVEERIQRNVDQFVAALRAAVGNVFGDTEAAGDDEIEKGRNHMGNNAVMKTRSTVIEEVNRLAEELLRSGKAKNMRQARVMAWRENAHLRKSHEELPAEELSSVAAAPVFKGAGAVEAIAVVAGRIRKENPSLSEAQARTRAWKERPDLQQCYREATSK